MLEFKMLDEDNQMKLDLPARIPKDREAEVMKQAEAKLPEGSQILFERAVERDTGREYRIPYLVKKRVMLTGDVLSDARVSIGQFNDPYVSMTLTRKADANSSGYGRKRQEADGHRPRQHHLFGAGHPRADQRREGADHRALFQRKRPTTSRSCCGPARCRRR